MAMTFASTRRAAGLCVASLAIWGFSAGPAFAYLDPGTGSMVIQVVIGAVAAGLIGLKMAWGRITAILRKPPTQKKR